MRAQCGTTAVGYVGPYVGHTAAWDPDGAGPLPEHLVVTGSFTSVPGIAANGIAAWNPQTATWSTFGSGVAGAGVLGVLPGGDLVVGGSFASAGGGAANNIARWTGSAWAPLGGGVTSAVGDMVVTPGGEVVVIHPASWPMWTVSRWDGVSWTSLGSWAGGQLAGPRLAIAPNGDLLRGGQAGIERWDGLTWLPHAPGITSIRLLASTPDGRLFAAGTLPAQGLRCAVWDGAAWTALGPQILGPFGNPALLDLEFLPDGDPVICGFFGFSPLGTVTGGLARWTGSTWVGFGPGGVHGLEASHVFTATFLRDGQLIVTTMFSGLTSFQTTCPATALSYGAGCTSSGGTNTLTATSLPWADGTFRATGTGLPNVAIVIAATSVTPIPQGVAPLSGLLPPHGQPGCDLLVAPHFLEVMVTLTGTAQSSLFLPNVPSIVGVVFYHQMVPIELDGLGHWVAITSTNALQLTGGTF
ncbi:MAG TPA: hypothetical protein VFD82_05795 [Planctomycetota bacterium]|nr:hypothetical protein [Planctomycetota bacterium]